MPQDLRVDAYIERANDFAKPILELIRSRVHAACPEAEETLKWGMPTFVYKGESLAGMAAFKAHASFSFWQRGDIAGAPQKQGEGMGQFGRLTGVYDLPEQAIFAAMVHEACALIDSGAKVRRKTAGPKAGIAMPDDFAAALDAADARARFDAFPPGARREYLEWITDAKRPETRAKRIAEAVPWIAEGKKRNWKYEKC